MKPVYENMAGSMVECRVGVRAPECRGRPTPAPTMAFDRRVRFSVSPLLPQFQQRGTPLSSIRMFWSLVSFSGRRIKALHLIEGVHSTDHVAIRSLSTISR